ncbi:aminopeptidase N [Dactylosporangium sp. NPDC049742]|uniref:aminopeptidase N n=1 Tax=Dactylosporangium sp. NPDC049742 TaxID=3154737 RepID=UPI00344A3E5F
MSNPSLTQAEAEHRAALLAVEHYAIDIDLTELPSGPRVRCVSQVRFTCGEPGAQSFVDCAAEVVSAELNGVPLPPAQDGRIPLPGLEATNHLRVETVQAETKDGEGVHKAVDPADGEIYVWTSFEPDEAHFVWACFDQPDLKAPHQFTVLAPPQWTVVSNSGDPVVTTAGAARRWQFPATPPLSAYNTVVNAGPFHEVRREVDGHDLGLLTRRSLAAVLDRDADELFALTRQGLAFYGEVFRMPFPQRRYDQVFVPEFGGAMENYGCVTWSDSFMYRSAPTPAERELRAKVLLHEMAHMWFGNIVTMRWWDDLWLNEAFAEFACNWAAERATEFTDAWAGHLAEGKLLAYLADQGPATHPIRQPIHDVAQAMSIFDAITYPKGASVLHQLMRYVGEADFATGMATYFARYAWSNTTLQDLIDTLGAASGRDLNAWRTGWLETAGTDRITLRHTGDGFVLDARGPDGPPRPQVLAVGAYRSDGGERLERTALVQVEIAGPTTPVDLPSGADLYLVNDEDLTFATTRPSPFPTATALPSAISRGVAVATVWDILLTGEVSAAEAVRCLTGVLLAETSGSVIEPYLTLAADVAERWSPDAERPELIESVAATCRKLAEHPDQAQVALRTLARTAADLDEVTWLRSRAGDDVDLRWRALARAAELGGTVDADIDALLGVDPDPDAWVRATGVRAASPDPAVKESVWQAVVVDRSVPINEVKAVMATFWRPGQDATLAPFAARYLELAPQLHRGGMTPAMVFANRLFPLHGVDEPYLRRAETVTADVAPVVAKYMTERIDIVRRMLHTRTT